MRARLLCLAAVVAAGSAPARAQLGLDLTDPPPAAQEPPAAPAPAKAPKPAEAPPAPKTTSMEPLALDEGAPPGAAAQRLAAAKQALAAGKDEEAALALHTLLRDPAFAEVHAEARVQLAIALGRLGLHRAAAARIEEALPAVAPSSPLAQQALDAIVELADRSGEDELVARLAGRLSDAPLPKAHRARLEYLLAKWSYERAVALEEAGRAEEARRTLAEARRHAAAVPADAGGVRVRARFVEGLAAYAAGEAPGALEAFKEVVRLTNPRSGRGDPGLRQLAFMQLARLHYEHRQNRYAIFYYGKLPQDGAGWLEALWESSYAHYRIGDYERALGNLLTLHSPYFRDEWFPESHLLKAIIYYENCRYPEARAILEGFERDHAPVLAALTRLATAEASPAALFDRVTSGKADPDPRLATRLSKLALADRTVRQRATELAALRREAGAVLGRRSEAFRASSLAQEIRGALDRERSRVAADAGARARDRLERERAGLRDLLEQGLRVRVEVSRREREALEASLARGGPASVLKDYRYSTAVSDEHLYWPYDGEFWRDELGTYAYTLTKGCRDEAPRDVRAAR